MEEKDRIVDKLRQSNYVQVLDYLSNVSLIEGRAKLLGNKRVQVGERILEADKIIITIGAQPYIPPFEGIDNVDYFTSTDMLELKELPESLIVIGGRAVGLELGQVFHRFGSKVTILQRSKRILPEQEPEIAEMLQGYLSEEGINIKTGVTISRLYQDGDTKYVEAKVNGATEIFRGSQILRATGRKPILNGLGLENEGVKRARMWVKVLH